MYKRRLVLSAHFDECPVEEQIRLFAKVGFEGFFTGWQPGAPVARWRKTADECGMLYQSIHGPFRGCAEIWKEDSESAENFVQELKDCVRDCADNGVALMISHAFIGFYTGMKPTEIGLERFGRVIREAERRGVKIAFENTEGEEFLAAVLNAFGESPNVGFCWDTGHEMCYNGRKDMTALYGQYLLGTHLNDNLGARSYDGVITWHDDLHLLPYDGIGDWAGIAARLDKAGFPGPLTFELNRTSKPDRHENDAYGRVSLEEYVTAAYMRACRVAALTGRPGTEC